MSLTSPGPEKPADTVLRFWVPPALYAAIIFYLSSIPDLAPPVEMSHADKAAHFLEYGGFGFLLYLAVRRTWRSRPELFAGLLTVALGAATAMGDELFQGTVGRTRSVWDWTADVAGLAAAAAAGTWLFRRRRRRTEP